MALLELHFLQENFIAKKYQVSNVFVSKLSWYLVNETLKSNINKLIRSNAIIQGSK